MPTASDRTVITVTNWVENYPLVTNRSASAAERQPLSLHVGIWHCTAIFDHDKYLVPLADSLLAGQAARFSPCANSVVNMNGIYITSINMM